MIEVNDIRLRASHLDVAEAVTYVTCPEAGGIGVFLGTTRAEVDPGRGLLLALEYFAYEEMAVQEIVKLVGAARGQWPIARVVIWHRIGRVAVGEASVIIAVSCPHRGEAFDACEFLIDALKKLAPIWKKEIFQREERWQGG